MICLDNLAKAGQDDGFVGTGAGARVAAKTQTVVDNRHLLLPVAAESAGQASSGGGAVVAAPAPLGIHAGDNVVPHAAAPLLPFFHPG